jgi:hypothetical protein
VISRVLRELGLDAERLPQFPILPAGRGVLAPESRTLLSCQAAGRPDRLRSETLGAATITATYIKHEQKRHGKQNWRVLIRPASGSRITRVVQTEQDAQDLVRHFNRLGMAGVDIGQALAESRSERQRTYPRLREALPAFLDEQEPHHARGDRSSAPRDPESGKVRGERRAGELPAHSVLPVADERPPARGGEPGGRPQVLHRQAALEEVPEARPPVVSAG